MKKVILLLFAVMPLVSSCQKQEIISDVKGTTWNFNTYFDDGSVSLKYLLYLDYNGSGKLEFYNMNATTEKLRAVYQVNYEQNGNMIKFRFSYTSDEYMTIYYFLDNNKLKQYQQDEDSNTHIALPMYFTYLGKK